MRNGSGLPCTINIIVFIEPRTILASLKQGQVKY